MAGDTVITVIGNLTADPELRFTPAGAAVANFTVASTPRTFDRQTNEWKDGEALFMRCNIWRDAAENVAESFTRGSRVIVSGRLKQRSYETREGEKRTVVELEVDEIGPSLRYATAKVNKANRGGGGGGGATSGSSGGSGGGRPSAAPAAGRRRSVGQCAAGGSFGGGRRRTTVLIHTRSGTSENGVKTCRSRRWRDKVIKKKVCTFCKEKNTQIDYKDTTLLRKYVSDRGKIRARRVTGNCVQHQRDVAIAVKNSREVALLPYATDGSLRKGRKEHEADPHR